MKYVLLVANGDIATHFVHKILSGYSSNNFYIVLCKENSDVPKEYPSTFKFFQTDYTSHFRLDNILSDYELSDAFIVLDDEDEGRVVYEYLRTNYKKMRIIQSIHTMSEYYDSLKDSNLILITQTNAMASRLLLRMPNVPVIPRGFGLEQGEIMEIGIPSGSILAHRQISTIRRLDYIIVGIYRRNAFLLANEHLVIEPGDTILVAGKPEALKNLYVRVKSEMGQFPSPFGREMYLIVDMRLQSKERILFDCKEAIFLHRNLKSTKLTIKVLHAGDFKIIDELEKIARFDIFISIDYDNLNFIQTINNKTDKKVGLIIIGSEFFLKKAFRKALYESQIPVFRTALNPLAPSDFEIIESDSKDKGSVPSSAAYSLLVIAGDYKRNSDISTLIFDISKQLHLSVNVYDFEPDNHFNMGIEEEFSNLSRIFECPFHIEKSNIHNPIFYLQNLQKCVLHFVPFSAAITRSRFLSLFKTNFEGLAYNLDSNPQFYLPTNT